MRWSLPQIPATRTRTRTSQGPTVGTGTSSRTMPRLAGSLTTASMVVLERAREPLALEEPRRLTREIRDDEVRARAPDGRERLQHAPLLVEPPEPTGRLDHRVLPRDRVRGQREPELLPHPGDDVQVREGRLDHDDVRALVHVQ